MENNSKNIVTILSIIVLIIIISYYLVSDKEEWTNEQARVQIQAQDTKNTNDDMKNWDDNMEETKMIDDDMESNDTVHGDTDNMDETTDDTAIMADEQNKDIIDEMIEEAPVEIMADAKWVYTEYSDTLLANAKGNIVLFFHATWCPSCKSADQNLSDSDMPEWLTILKLDYDANVDLRKKYWITTQHTFVQVDNKWNMTEKWIWSRDLESVLAKIK